MRSYNYFTFVYNINIYSIIHCSVDMFYANTSTKEAFHLVNPILWASRADIWRQAILYMFGGLYLDFDVFIKYPLDSFIFINDSFVYSFEKSREGFVNRYNGDNHFGQLKQHIGDRNVLHAPPRKQGEYTPSLVQWMIIAKPRNVFIERTLCNIIELVGKEFMGSSMMWSVVQRQIHLLMFYTTGPLVFTASVEEVLQEFAAGRGKYNDIDIYHRLYPKTNFREVGARHYQKKSYSNEVKKYIQENHGYSPRLLQRYFNHP